MIDHLTEILLLAYADDLAIMTDNIVEMKKILRYLLKYTQINKLTVNIEKTKVVIFQKGGHGHKKNYPALFFGKEIIEITKKYEYLGVPFAESALFLSAVQSAKSKASLAIGAVAWYTVDKLFETLVASIGPFRLKIYL